MSDAILSWVWDRLRGASRQATIRTGNLSDDLPEAFLKTWPGCADEDCLPQCWLSKESGHCERMEIAFQLWLDKAVQDQIARTPR